ncbi:hypothetical protein HY029_03265 [Candidatus Gottesmanbacteria bacterium]|nr:hypothetical protein [Candidatus Gottesmanbacteria bacterium]
MHELISKLQGKNIHIVGVSGAEGSNILRFLAKHKISGITAHDFSNKISLEKNFRLWHKGLMPQERNKQYQQFKNYLSNVKLNLDKSYLSDIQQADIVFVPQSWRLYKMENLPLFSVVGKIPFYSLTRLYLDFAPAKIIAVTGTVGKGSTANIIFQLLNANGKKAYFAGNDTWMAQLGDKLDEMAKDDFLVLEISHRQLLDGFTKAPYMVVVTNLYPNHLDEVSWEEYINLKLSLVRTQEQRGISILNYDIPQLRLDGKLKSKIFYFSVKTPEKNTKSIQNIYDKLLNNKSDQYLSNLLAGLTVLEILGQTLIKVLPQLLKIKPLPARIDLIGKINGINFYDDIKSTTPWATVAAVNKLGENTILICGGKTKGIDYNDFANNLLKRVKFTIMIKSELSETLVKLMPEGSFILENDLAKAISIAYKKAIVSDNILLSPGAGFFYSDFIKGKKSYRKLITSLLPKEQV